MNRSAGHAPEALLEQIREYHKWFWNAPERNRRGRLELVATRQHIVEVALQRLGIAGIWVDHTNQGLPNTSAVRPDRIIRTLAERKESH